MKFSKSLTALVIVGASISAPVASAQDNFIQSVVSRILSSAVEVTVDEIQQQTSQSVANAAHHVSMDTAGVATKIKVTELTAEQANIEQLTDTESKSKKSLKSE